MPRWIRFGSLFLFCVMLLPFPAAGAAETAQSLDGNSRVWAEDGTKNLRRLFDGNTTQSLLLPSGTQLHLEDAEGISSLYLIFDLEPGAYTITDLDSGEIRTCGQQGFLHEFIDLTEAFGNAPTALQVDFGDTDVRMNELYLFSPGKIPDFVQKWEPPREGKTDLLLLSAHGDDEHLFFAGMLPYYAGDRGYEVLVAYLTNHRNWGTLRCHEMLDGLWAVGVTTYPVFGTFGDYYSRSIRQAYALHERSGESGDALLGYVTELLRRYKPQAAVSHDINGEYGHGQHRLCAQLLRQALDTAADPDHYPETAAQWGTWQVPKLYLHMWPENQIILDWDRPLSRFGGMTAFQVSQQLGFPSHKSQYGGFAWYMEGYQRASDIPRYNPCQFGLYHSSVGTDQKGGSLFENLISYAQQEGEVAARMVIRQGSRMKFAAHTAWDTLRSQVSETVSHQSQTRREAASEYFQTQIQYFVVTFAILGTISAFLLFFWRQRKK